MRSKAEKRVSKQGAGESVPSGLDRIRQLLLPMVAGMAATKKDLMDWVKDVGLEALKALFEADATAIAGPKGRHRPQDRTHHWWGTTPTELPFGGRRIRVERPRVRSRSGKETTLPSGARFQAEDPLPAVGGREARSSDDRRDRGGAADGSRGPGDQRGRDEDAAGTVAGIDGERRAVHGAAAGPARPWA